MLTAAKEGTFSAPSDPCVLFPLAASGVYPKTRVWGSREKTLHCFSATAELRIELRRGCENSSGKTEAGSALDSNGNTQTRVVGSNTTTYAWDFENRMSSVTLPGTGGTVSFKYDPFGRRIYKSSSAATSIYAYDGDNLVEETNAAGAAVARYSQTQNIDEPLALLRSGATSYYHADGLGSVTSLSSATGSIANTYTYDSFGKLTASTGSLVNPFQYTARESDTETGLYYYRARYYDQNTGRFISEDPLGFDGDAVDFYGYAYGNATNFSDAFGLAGTGTATAPAPAPVKEPPKPIPEPPLPTPPEPGPGPGWWPGLGALLRPGLLLGLGQLFLAPGTSSTDTLHPDFPPTPATPKPPCDDNNGPDCKKATPFHLDGAGIGDPHAFKKDFLGNKAPISRYDICACKDGSIIIKLRGQCGSPGPGTPTPYRWK